MLKQKLVGQRGKLSLSELFSTLNVGDKVALVRDLSFKTSFPVRMQGKTGTVIEKRGEGYVVSFHDGVKKVKTITVKKINLKKLSN